MKRRKSLKRGIVFLLLQLCILTWMQETLVIEAANQKVIRVGYPQIQGTSETYADGIYSGYTYEYLKKISQITGWEYEFITPKGDENEQINTLMEMLSKGEIDLLGSTLKLEDVEKQYDFPENSYGITYTTLSVSETNSKGTISAYNRYRLCRYHHRVFECDCRRYEY